MEVRIRLPEREVVDLGVLLRRVAECGPLAAEGASDAPATPFAADRLDFCERTSRDLFGDPECRRYPEVQALAFWMRPASLHRLRAQFTALREDSVRLAPRGLVLHIPPANVDTLFVYSWLLSFLVGNDNVVRLPQKLTPPTEAILRIFQEELKGSSPSVRRATLMVSYGHEREITEGLSSLADVRVIWGGDATVREIRSVPLPPHAKELTFPDRFSFSAVKAGAYLVLDRAEREDLAERFFADAYWFDQLACSSPRLLVWCGSAQDAEQAGPLFFECLKTTAERRGYDPDTGTVLKKLTFACRSILDLPVSAFLRYGNALTVLTLESLAEIRGEHCGAGLFYQHRVDRLADLAAFIQRQDQTLSHFGFSEEELDGLVTTVGSRGLDRLVPIGQALTFNRFWDGFDLLQEFTRRVWIEEGR